MEFDLLSWLLGIANGMVLGAVLCLAGYTIWRYRINQLMRPEEPLTPAES